VLFVVVVVFAAVMALAAMGVKIGPLIAGLGVLGAFDANGIKFAFPTVQIASEGESSTAATGAVAQRALELTKPAAA
jgi:small-conductance mechanosensitive channel